MCYNCGSDRVGVLVRLGGFQVHRFRASAAHAPAHLVSASNCVLSFQATCHTKNMLAHRMSCMTVPSREMPAK